MVVAGGTVRSKRPHSEPLVPLTEQLSFDFVRDLFRLRLCQLLESLAEERHCVLVRFPICLLLFLSGQPSIPHKSACPS